MPFNIEQVGNQLAADMIAALHADGGKLALLVKAEGYKLAWTLARIAEMLGQKHIDLDEAQMLARVQKDASEVVLASLAEVSRVAARQAVLRALSSVTGLVDKAAGFPVLGTLAELAVIKR